MSIIITIRMLKDNKMLFFLYLLVYGGIINAQNSINSAINLGHFSLSIDISNNYYVKNRDCVYYRFDVDFNGSLIATNCGSSMDNTSLLLLDNKGNIIQNGKYYWPDNGCRSPYMDYLEYNNLTPGIYYIASKSNGFDGDLVTNLKIISNTEKNGTSFLKPYIDPYAYGSGGCSFSTKELLNTYGSDNPDAYIQLNIVNDGNLLLCPGQGCAAYLFNDQKKLISQNVYKDPDGKYIIYANNNIVSNVRKGVYYLIMENLLGENTVSYGLSVYNNDNDSNIDYPQILINEIKERKYSSNDKSAFFEKKSNL